MKGNTGEIDIKNLAEEIGSTQFLQNASKKTKNKVGEIFDKSETSNLRKAKKDKRMKLSQLDIYSKEQKQK